MSRNTRPISWLKGARRDFDGFPLGAQVEIARALTILAEGQMPEIAKPLTGFGSGVMELALRFATTSSLFTVSAAARKGALRPVLPPLSVRIGAMLPLAVRL